jgi:hypothetical protein
VLTELVDRLAFQRLRSPLARAVVPVLGGALVIALIMLATWGIAALVKENPSERLAPSTFTVGGVENLADEIVETGPLIFPGLNTTTGERTLVLDHEGDDPTSGWHVYWAYPADRDASCAVAQVDGTSTFTDCDGRNLDVTGLARPTNVHPTIENRETLSIDLRSPVSTTTSP